MFYQKFLEKGNTIGVPAVSDGDSKETGIVRFKNAINFFENNGYKVVASKNLYNSEMGRSSDALTRANEFNEMIANKNIDYIMCAAGGDFLLEILPYIDFQKIKENPKFIQGFSDPTGIMYPITTKCDIATIYAPNFKSFGMECLEEDLKNCLEIIKGNIKEQNSFKLCEEEFGERVTGLEGYNLTKEVEWKLLKGNVANFSGRIIGGCFDNICEIAGTKYDGGAEFVERYKEDGTIWYFDNFAMSNEAVIRNLWRFNELGYFKYTKGIIFGRFCFESSDLGYTIEKLLKDSVISKLNIPIVYEADISHKSPSFTVINGAFAEVEVKEFKGKINLKLK